MLSGMSQPTNALDPRPNIASRPLLVGRPLLPVLAAAAAALAAAATTAQERKPFRTHVAPPGRGRIRQI